MDTPWWKLSSSIPARIRRFTARDGKFRGIGGSEARALVQLAVCQGQGILSGCEAGNEVEALLGELGICQLLDYSRFETFHTADGQEVRGNDWKRSWVIATVLLIFSIPNLYFTQAFQSVSHEPEWFQLQPQT
jgi:hypothetical protein